MGIFNVTIAVANVHGHTFEEVEVTVDTACDYTTVPQGDATAARRTGERRGHIGDGRRPPGAG